MVNTLIRSLRSTAADIGMDTGVVLFFLTIEYARAATPTSIDGVLMGMTVLMLWTLPYFLTSNASRLSVYEWFGWRAVVAVAGLTIGLGLRQSSGSVIADNVGFLPMTLLILTGMASCYFQFYGLMKLRLAK